MIMQVRENTLLRDHGIERPRPSSLRGPETQVTATGGGDLERKS